jgi:hypothetical protein
MLPTMRKYDLALQNCQMLLRALWQYQYPAVYRILRELPWPDPLKGVVQKYDGERTCPYAPGRPNFID